MSSFEILDRFNEYSTELINEDPKVRIKGIRNLANLYWDAPELKLSIVTKLEQLSGDENEEVASFAKRYLNRIKSGRHYREYYPYSRRESSLDSTRGTPTRQEQKIGAIIGNIVCCIIIIIVYIVVFNLF